MVKLVKPLRFGVDVPLRWIGIRVVAVVPGDGGAEDCHDVGSSRGFFFLNLLFCRVRQVCRLLAHSALRTAEVGTREDPRSALTLPLP
jgi:hypothetical protein